ncbi:hypothetical protein, partial [Brunnivagina elsteri]
KSPHVDAFSVFTYLYIVWFFYAHLLKLGRVLDKLFLKGLDTTFYIPLYAYLSIILLTTTSKHRDLLID